MTAYSITKKLAGGKTKTYHYAYQGGPRLHEEPGTTAFELEIKGHRQHKYETEPDSLAELIEDYRSSASFKALKVITRRDYERCLDEINEEFGTAGLRLFEDRRMRRRIKLWRDRKANTPRMADYRVTVLKRVLAHGVDNGDLSVNVAARMQRLYSADRSDIIWKSEEIDAFLKVASPALGRAFRFALMSGLRRTDLAAITWAADKGTYLSWTASKTRARITIPVTDELRVLLDECKAFGGLTILLSVKGLPWRPDGLSTSFQRTRAMTDIKKRWHDLRGTAATNFCRAGLDDREVGAVLGWSEKSVEQIRKRYVTQESIVLSVVERLNQRKKQDTEEMTD